MRVLLSMLFLAAPAVAAAAAEQPQPSWGKPGVTLDVYRADANLCASQAWNTEIADTEAVKVFKEGTQQIDNLIDSSPNSSPSTLVADTGTAGFDPVQLNRAAQIGRIVESARPRERFQELRELQMGTLARCLRERGYVQFLLTDAQRKALKRLDRGTAERHAYLHRLASDPQVLEAQRTGG